MMLIQDVAALCGVTPQTIREWVRRRGFPAPRNEKWMYGRRGRPTQQFDAGAVAQWLTENGAQCRAEHVLKCKATSTEDVEMMTPQEVDSVMRKIFGENNS